MQNIVAVQLDVQLDSSKVEIGVAEVGKVLTGLEQVANNVSITITKAFTQVQNVMENVRNSIGQTMDTLTATSGSEQIAPIIDEHWYDGIVSFADGVNRAFNAVNSKVGEIEVLSKNIKPYFETINAAINKEGNFLTKLFPKTGEVVSIVGGWTGKISRLFENMNMGINLTSVGWGALIAVAIAAVIGLVKIIIDNWDAIVAALGTAAEWFNTNVIQPIVGFFTGAMDWISTKVQEGMAFVEKVFSGLNEFLQGVFAKDWTEQFGAFGNVLNAFFANVENVWNAVKSIFSGIVSFVKNVFAGDWGAAWDSIVSVFKGIWDHLVAVVKAPINGIIGMINGLVEGVVAGINLVINALNGLSFDIPDWVPVFGGQTFGFDITPLVAPKIPLLAKGAVLPANKPFLALVGDQRHGTNVEAPLATIQEAVALVMEDQFNGMMAGFEAVTARQEQILETLMGIEIGDTTIGQAAMRYNRKMAIIKGGM